MEKKHMYIYKTFRNYKKVLLLLKELTSLADGTERIKQGFIQQNYNAFIYK